MERVKPLLELEDEIDLHKKGWILQRIGWVVIFVLLVAAAIGLFGSGWLSSKQITRADVTVSFERFARFENPMTLTIKAKSEQGTITVRFPQSYFEKMELDKIVPAPTSHSLEDGNLAYRFRATPSATLTFYMIPKTTGTVAAQILVNSTEIPVSHFVYP